MNRNNKRLFLILAGMALRLSDDSEVAATENPFADVQPGQFYTDAVAWAVEKGVTNGMGDGTFGIGSICNRAQVVTFLYRAYN